MLRWCDKHGQVSADASAADEKKTETYDGGRCETEPPSHQHPFPKRISEGMRRRLHGPGHQPIVRSDTSRHSRNSTGKGEVERHSKVQNRHFGHLHFTRDSKWPADSSSFIIEDDTARPKAQARVSGVTMDLKGHFDKHIAEATARGLETVLGLRGLKGRTPAGC